MSLKLVSRFFVIFTLFAMFFPFMPAHALEVKDVRFGIHEDKTRIVLDMDQAADFQSFVLSDPYRLVVDLPRFTWSVKNFTANDEAGILAVRQGALKPGVSRIVFDLSRSMSIRSAFVLPAKGQKGDRLVIDIARIGVDEFKQFKGQIHGNLDINNPPNNAGQSFSNKSKSKANSAVKNDYKPLVVIDPGHGGVDPGAVGKEAGLLEKDVVLKLALSLRDALVKSGRYRVKMTRSTDVFISLRGRVKFARDAGADLFVSIHADSIGNKKVRGASVYTLSEKASDKQTAALAARENKADLIAGIDLSVEDQDVVNILVDLARRDTMNQSKFFAGKLATVLPKEGVRTLEHTHRYAGFAVLKAPDIPSVLVEAGFMSNKNEARMLNTETYRNKVVSGLKRGINAYFDQVQKNQRE